MGRLLFVHSCPVCNYFVEGELHHGNSGISAFFLRNHYALAICRNCRNLASVLVANNAEQTRAALSGARHDIVQMEADAVIGDQKARDLLPLFREALDTFDGDVPGEVSLCTVCGSSDVDVFDDINAEQFDAQDVWMRCPRCAEGKLLIETAGQWH